MKTKISTRNTSAVPMGNYRPSRTRICLWLALVCCLYSTSLADVYPCPARCTCTGPIVPEDDSTTSAADVTVATILFSENEDIVINCSGIGLSKFPQDINSAVQVLDLSLNGIDTLPTPRSLASLKYLKKLLLRGNRIQSPINSYAFHGLRSMELIDLSRNAIFSLPVNVFESCKRLEKVLLSGNKKLSKIPSLATYSVKYMELSDCGIKNVSFTVLPESIHSLTLRGNPLGTLPGDGPISSKTLEILDVRSCSFTGLHRESLSRLPSLTTLRLSGNRALTSIDSVWSDSLRTIEAVDCSLGSGNEDEAPLAAMSHLTRAYLSGNSIKSLGPNSLLPNPLLVYLDLSRNGLKTIGSGLFYPLRNLQSLNLSRNSLSELHYSVFSFNQHLGLLDISHNSLISSLPSLMANSLYELVASHCGITELGHKNNFLSGMPNLKLLDLSNNPLEDLTDMASNALRALNLAFCRLVVVRASFLAGLPHLETLVLVGNRIASLDPNSAKHLKYLAISDNPWNCACKDQDFLELWKIVERLDPQGQLLHCAPSDKDPKKAGKIKEPGEGLKQWSDVCYRSFPISPTRSSSAMWSVFVALVLTLGGVVVSVIVFRHWTNRRRKETERRNAADAERRIQRLRRGDRRSEGDEDGGERRTRHRDVVTVRRRREEAAVSEPPSYEEAVLMPRPEEVEVTLVSTPVDQQDSSPPEGVELGGQMMTEAEASDRQEGEPVEEAAEGEREAAEEDSERQSSA